MSHVRNLLHKRSPQLVDPPPAPMASVMEAVAESPALPELAVAPSLPEFPVVEACIDPSSRIVFHTEPRSPAADRFRLLRMRLRELSKNGKLKRLLVTSPLPGDGKSTMILNLATAMSERSKHSVLVLEADLHHSSIAKKLGIVGPPGLAECLQDGLDPLTAIRSIEPLGWYLLSAGDVRKNPSELLQTPALGHVVQRLSGLFDWVLLDSPPASPLTDTLLLQQHADATMLVVRAGSTPREAVEHTVGLLGSKSVIGTILNGVEGSENSYYNNYASRTRE
jgi:capsular exopolysaccharide synthesis family protein